MVCWGYATVVDATPARPMRGLAAGGDSICGLEDDGTVTCWSENAHGQATAMPGHFEALAAGNVHTCGLRPDGSVSCTVNELAEYHRPN